jgi:hypothetical protein
MLIHRQNSYAPCGNRRTCRHEAQGGEPVNKVKKKTLCSSASDINVKISSCGEQTFSPDKE